MKQPDTFTSPVGPLLARYLTLKRALGRRAVAMAYILRYLDRFLVSCHATDLTRETFGDCEKSNSSSVFIRGRWASRSRRSTVFRSRSSSSVASNTSR